MAKVQFFDECKWNDAGDGALHEFLDNSGEKLAEVSLINFDSKLWRYEVILPVKYQLEEKNPAGVVYSAPAAKRVAEMILLNTILVRS